jgi:hypothetical protein
MQYLKVLRARFSFKMMTRRKYRRLNILLPMVLLQ